MTGLKLIKARPKGPLDRYKIIYFRRLNEIHIGAQITCRALVVYAESVDGSPAEAAERKRYHHFQVPSGTRPTARIKRNQLELQRLVGRAVEVGEFQKSLVLAVSVTEDFLINLIRLILRAHPDRLARGPKKGEAKPTVMLEDFVARGRDDILEELIRNRIGAVFYSKPAEYLAYLSGVLEIEVPAGVVEAFVETKATRDIIVHTNGQANQRYLDKAGEMARVGLGKPLVIDSAYFDSAFAAMKNLIQQITDRFDSKYASDVAVLNRAADFFD